MGFTALVCQTFAGDFIDKTSLDRRTIIVVAATMTACSALAVLFVREGNQDHMLMYITKVVEGLASSFIAPCLAALTMALFGPHEFDTVMANNTVWGHIGSAISAILAGGLAFIFYPKIKICFYVIGLSALCAIICVKFIPEGDQLMGRGFHSSKQNESEESKMFEGKFTGTQSEMPKAASYLSVMLEPKTLILCITGFFFQ
jgi:MFS family permease